jgi:hypothetical protein
VPKTIQICDVPDEIYRALLDRAERDGLALSDFILRAVTRIALLEAAEPAERPSLAEIMTRAEQRKPLKPVTEEATTIIRERRGR